MPERIPAATLNDRLFAALQYALPKHALSRVIYGATRTESAVVRRLLIWLFLRRYRVNLAEALQSDPATYRSFNEFFTRSLRPDARPIAPDPHAVVSPVDGTVTEAGSVHGDTMIQAKGIHYRLEELLAGDTVGAAAYGNGAFVCIYLAPNDYHRIHMPIEGCLRSTVYIPGDLFSVSAASTRAVPRLFARNERVVCDFDTALGRMAVILVGALFVGSIETVYAGEINPPSRRRQQSYSISRGIGQTFSRGAELARFNMGSTVVLLFQQDRIGWGDALEPLARVCMGERIGRSLVAIGR